MVVVSGDGLSGIFGTDTLQTPVVHGLLVEVGRRLLQLHRRLNCKILITEVGPWLLVRLGMGEHELSPPNRWIVGAVFPVVWLYMCPCLRSHVPRVV